MRSIVTSRRRSASAAESGCARPSSDSRYVTTTSRRIAPCQRSTWPSRIRLARSAQCTSSSTRTVGRPWPIAASRPVTASSSRNRSSDGAGSARTAGQDAREHLLVAGREGRPRRLAAAPPGSPTSASTQAWYGTSASSVTRPASTAAPSHHVTDASSAASRVLPMPGSPATSSRPVPPWRMRSYAPRAATSSSARPTSGEPATRGRAAAAAAPGASAPARRPRRAARRPAAASRATARRRAPSRSRSRKRS